MMQRNICWFHSVWALLLWCALFGPCTEGQRPIPRHPRCRYDNLMLSRRLHPGNLRPQTHSRYCDPSNDQASGAITQKCGSGYYRERTGPLRGQCRPCSCNGLTNECEEHTGKCLNCQFNTDGDQCERCKAGYYGNAAQRTCRGCPCPFIDNNFALACLDVDVANVECLCILGYAGTRCERCATGYYGNPMIYGGSCQPCNCGDGNANICDSYTGECKRPGDSGIDDPCHECDSCTEVLLSNLERMDDELESLRQELQNTSHRTISLTRLKMLEDAIAKTKGLVGRYSSAVNAQAPKVEQLKADVQSVKEDMRLLKDKANKTFSNSENVLEGVTQTHQRAGDLVSEAQDLFMKIQELLKQQSEMKPTGEGSVTAQKLLRRLARMMQEMRRRGCTPQKQEATTEQEEAHKLLDFIRNDMAVPLDAHQAIANETAGSLMTSGSALRDLEEVVSEAEVIVDRTRGLNLHSDASLRDLLQLIDELETQRDAILPVVEMTKDQLTNMTELLGMLKESKEEYEHLAAQINQAKQNLTEKLNDISKTEDIVVRAEEHALELNRLAMEFQVAVQNVTNSSDLLSPVGGMGAHRNIINAILEAETAANRSKQAADQALNDVEQQGLTKRTEELKDNASSLLTEAVKANDDLKEASEIVASHKRRVDQTKKKGEKLRNDALAVKEDLKNIQRDDIVTVLDSAKNAATAANDTVNTVTDRLNDISQEVDNISLSNIGPNISNILNEADKALRSLNTTWPTLEDSLQDLSSQTPPSANMSESVRRIKDIIEETRDFVNRLSMGLIFDGKGHVELRPPTNLEVKAFTAIDLLLNRHPTSSSPSKGRQRRQHTNDDANLFIFYLGNKDASGDYIGMAVRKNVLLCVYKLGGIVHEVESSHITETETTDFDKVLFQRVYQDAEVILIQNFTSTTPVSFPTKTYLPNTAVSLLNLDPDNVVFYVGGYPDGFTPPVKLRYPKFQGSMILSSINDKYICLYNYKHAGNIANNQTYLKEQRPKWDTQSKLPDYFQGTGYRMAVIINPDKEKRRLFKFHTNSREENAFLFYIGNEDSYYSVTMERGYLVLHGRRGNQVLKSQSPGKVSLSDTQFAIVVDDTFEVYIGGELISINSGNANFKNYYIGGLPTNLRERYNITAPPLRGCVDHVTADASSVRFNKTVGVRVGCLTTLLGVREAAFHPGGSLSVDPQDFWSSPVAMVSLGFRTTESRGVLLRTSQENHGFQLSLVGGYVVFNLNNNALKSNDMYNDGRWHYLTALKNGTKLELRVDNDDSGQLQPYTYTKPSGQEFVLGGETFRGCLANLHIRRPEESFIPADLSSFTQKGDVMLGMCSLERPPLAKTTPAALQQRQRKPQTGAQNAAVPSGCRLPTAQDEAYQLTGATSSLSYNITPEELRHRLHFSIQVRTRSSEGLLLRVAGRGDVSRVALYMANGKMKLSLGQDRVLRHKKRSNDGAWHTVEFSVEKNTFHLLIDGFRVTDGQRSHVKESLLDLQNPVYLGSDMSLSTSGTQSRLIPRKSVIGCISNFKVNNVLVGPPATNHGAPPCFEGASEPGAYFAGGRGHVVLGKFLSVGPRFELSFEARPRVTTGLLFHVRGLHRNILSVFMRDNKVEVQVNDGSGDYSASVVPPQTLCDGAFHEIAVSKQNNVIHLKVDSQSQRAVGPPRSSYTMTKDSLHIGGIDGKSKHKKVPVSSSFIGCLRNVKANGKPVAFEAASSVVGPVNVNECPAD